MYVRKGLMTNISKSHQANFFVFLKRDMLFGIEMVAISAVELSKNFSWGICLAHLSYAGFVQKVSTVVEVDVGRTETRIGM